MTKIARGLLWIAPIPIAVAIFFGSMRWMRGMDDTIVLVVSGAFAIFVMGWAAMLAKRVQRGMDEVQVAGQVFASTRGAVIGWGVVPLLILLPPVHNGLINLANTLSTGSADTSDRGAVLLGVVFGFMLLTVMQTLGTFVAQAIWQRRLNRAS